MPTPYALSSDLVSAWPAKSLAVAQYVDGYKLDTGPVQNAQTGNSYTFALTDTTQTVTANNAAASTYTVPPQSSVVWEDYTTQRIVNLGAGVVTLTGGVGVTLTGTVAMPRYSAATLVRTASNTWTVTGISAPPTSATATVATGQTTTSGTYTDLATAGPAVTLTTGTKALVIVTCQLSNDASLGLASMGFAVSGSTTIAAAQTTSLSGRGSADFITQASAVYLVTLTAGSNIFTAKYSRLTAGTSTFTNRVITVIDMGP
jgi:hypothetical protein